MKIILRAIVVAYACLAFSPLFAEQIRDYYAEPGLHPFKGSINQHFNEHIDPFGGTLQLSYLDLKIPGNGGMDINVYRTYTSRQNWAGEENVAGVGWTMHMGRVVVTYANRLKICSQNTYNVSALNNPSLELPDGRRELLFLYVDQTKAELITKSLEGTL